MPVEFLRDATEPASPGAPPARATRRAGVAALVTVAAVATALVVRGATAGADHPGARSASAAPSPTYASYPPTYNSIFDNPVSAADCPRLDARWCAVVGAVPGALRAAVHARFPGLEPIAAETDRTQAGTGRLWYREVQASGRGITLFVSVAQHQPADHTALAVDVTPDQAVIVQTRVLDRYTVVVQASARVLDPAQQPALIHDVRALAADARVAAV